jgi:hypothetical protein
MTKPTKPTRKRTRKPSKKKESESFEKILQASTEEVEEFLLERYKEEHEGFDNLPLPREILFCEAYMANGFKGTEAILAIDPEADKKKLSARVKTLLGKERVQNYLSRQLHLKRLRLGISQDYIAKKYLCWANLDITDFLDFKPASGTGSRRRSAAVYLKEDINKLPPMVRQSIKSVTVDDKGKVKVEFIDQKSALDSLAKILGFGNDKIKVDNEGHLHLHFDKQDEEA